jgi:hypothetical protein
MDAGTDAGVAADSGPPDSGPPLTCSDVTPLEGVLDGTVSVSFDTSMSETRPRDLGLGCGNVESELRWAPQEVVELTVPGTGAMAITLDTRFDGDTKDTFNTVLQVRRDCEAAPTDVFPPTCFDDAAQNDFRSNGTFTAMGGETVYVIVTGFSSPPAEQGTVDRGRVRLDVTVRQNSAPTISEGSLLLALEDTLVGASGSDADADVRGVALNFYAGGELLDIYGDGQATENGDVYVVFFEPAPTTADYVGSATVLGSAVQLAGYLRNVGADRAQMRVFDEAWTLSDGLMVDVVEANTVGLGETCDRTNVCRREMSCVSGVCAASGPAASACGRAVAIEIPAFTTEASAAMATGSNAAGMGNFAPSSADCVDPMAVVGTEAIYVVTIPDGVTADLLVTTDLPGTAAATDTVVYLRGECADSGTELACNDDINTSGMIYQSNVEARGLAAGDYYIFVELYGGARSTTSHQLRATLRPVLASGEACDMAGVLNRCATGSCAGGLCP